MGSAKKTIAYRFDSVGNRIGMTDPDGGRFTYAYDAVNRITHLENPQGDRTTYGYDAAGRRSVKKLANGTRASFTYDAASNLTTLANLKSDNTVISSFDYAYDRMGNRTSVAEADGSRVTWTYDATYQLTGEHRTGSHPYEDSYSYDASGNRLLKIHDGARTTSTYDAANQLKYSEDASGRTTYTFDEDGNQKVVEAPNGDRTTNTWDGENRMTSVQQPDGTRNTMAYEWGGLRVKLEESTGTKKFVWDEQNYLAETDENDDTQAVYTNEPRVYGNLVSQRRGSDSHWYHFDAIGSTRELTELSEVVTDTQLYDAWGSIITATGSIAYPFQFNGLWGYYHDSQLGNLYVRARTYSSGLARWSSIDPIGPEFAINLYIYVANRPTKDTDPSGLENELPPLPPFPEPPSTDGGLLDRCILGTDPCPKRTPVDCKTAAEDAYAASGLQIRCEGINVIFRCKRDCIPDRYLPEELRGRGPSLACPYPHPAFPTVIVCIYSTGVSDVGIPLSNSCREDSAITHEMVHVGQLCDRLRGGNPLNCEQRERPAYEADCRRRVELGFIFADDYQRCVDEGVAASCRAGEPPVGGGPSPIDRACQDLF